MANISWTSSSISTYFKTSLGNKSSVFDSLYSSLGDAKMIKNGTYGKLMKSYYAELKEQSDAEAASVAESEESEDTSSTESTTESSSTETTSSSTESEEMDVLDQLLSKSYQRTKISNTYLDDLLSKNYTSDGTKVESSEAATTVDTMV